VLIGATMIDRDHHLTPLSILDHTLMPGVLIHAQALAQRFDANRDIRPLGDGLTLLCGFILAIVCILAARQLGFNPQGAVYGFVGAAAIALASFAAYRWLRIDVPSIALAISWALGGTAGFISGSVERWIMDRV
jgi:CHASE2 domain-containing sensor protein